jgi:hypothetical protein
VAEHAPAQPLTARQRRLNEVKSSLAKKNKGCGCGRK